jgi:hypothetical protein
MWDGRLGCPAECNEAFCSPPKSETFYSVNLCALRV